MTAPTTIDGAMMTDEQIDTFWLYRKNLHDGELMPQLRDFARALLSASKPAAPDLDALTWEDQSTADPVEKARRVLLHLIEPTSAYFFDDGFPRPELRGQVKNVLVVLEALAASPAAPSHPTDAAAPAKSSLRYHPDERVSMKASEYEALVAAAAPAQSGEPVAWMYRCWDTVHLERNQIDHYYSVDQGETYVKGIPLYATPQSSQPVEAGEPVENIRFDFINSDGREDSKVISHDEMRERYAEMYKAAHSNFGAPTPSAVVLDDERAAEIEPAAYLVQGLNGHNEEYASVWIKRANADAAAAAIFRASITPLVQARAASPQATDQRCYAPGCYQWDGTDSCTCQKAAATQPAQTERALTDDLLVDLFYAAQSDITKFRIKARALLTAAQPASGGEQQPAQEE
jgi:hypothetical protein